MIMTGMADPGLLGREEGLHAGPLDIGQLPTRQRQEDGWERGCGALPGMASRVAPFGPRLMDSPPVRPPQQKDPPCRIGGQSEREVTHLGHTQRDQVWLGRRPPFLPLASST
jgi:hypothetical protein